MKNSHKTRSLKTLSSHEISTQMWLSIDDVLKMLPLSRSTLWKLISEERFPSPYKHRGKAIWPKAEIEDEILKICSDGIPLKNGKEAVTWDDIVSLLESNIGLTNREIAERLNADVLDVTSLTRLMAKAGDLKVGSFYNGKTSSKNPLIYMINRQKLKHD